MAPEAATDKSELRRRMMALRSGIPDPDFDAICRSVNDRLVDVIDDAGALTVLAYWPLGGSREIDLRPSLLSLHDRGVRIGLPVVDADRTNRTLVFRTFHDEASLAEGPFGTRHPAAGDLIDPSAADVIIVPALAADRRGIRLGWGGGYYDRLLARVNTRTVCPLCSVCLVDSLPAEGHDRPVSMIVTESETIRTTGRP